jgi:hypothetical protein
MLAAKGLLVACVLVTAFLGSSLMLAILNAATLHWWR